jgi:hypothetical protein
MVGVTPAARGAAPASSYGEQAALLRSNAYPAIRTEGETVRFNEI